ncbi:hypothetical protein BGW80DRAFT_1307027 [Lactifluus volemus]|nr:hypothetical protein BGW80DRAFT_1307027 [Lactifluus volemus]
MSSPGRSPLSAVFLLHLALEAPLAFQGLWAPGSLPFLQLNNTTLVILKMYATLVLGICIVALLCFPLPEFLPCKRALAIGLCVYHTMISTVLFQAPRFIPFSFGAFFESYKFTPEIFWGCLHGFLGLGFVAWWQGTVGYMQMVKRTE